MRLSYPGHLLDSDTLYLISFQQQNHGGTYSWKKRFYAHNSSFRNEDRRTETTLSEHIWEIKDQDLNYELNWKIIEKTHAFNPITLQCKLCLSEIYHILHPNNLNQTSLNKRLEVYNFCRHRKKYLLENARYFHHDKAGALTLKSVINRRDN